MFRLARQHIKDTFKALRYGHLRPALWETRAWLAQVDKKNIKVGDIYEDCSYHPVLCTESDYDDIAGISLFNGSQPRSCSIKYCAPRRLTADEVALKIKRRKEWLEAEKIFHMTGSGANYRWLQEEEHNTFGGNR